MENWDFLIEDLTLSGKIPCYIKIFNREKTFIEIGKKNYFEYQFNLKYCSKIIGQLEISFRQEIKKNDQSELKRQCLMLAALINPNQNWQTQQKRYQFLVDLKKEFSKTFNWVGFYFKGDYFCNQSAEDLYVGPYIGEGTSHEIIPVNQGLCGLAVREERVINMADVHSDSRHIACSLKTQSELIVPLYNAKKELIGEIDIDSNTKAAFKKEVEDFVKEKALSFQA